MSLEVEGVLHKKFETESKTESFQAREFVIQTEGQYPQYVKFQLVQDRCGAVDPFNEGEKIKVFFDLRGREWNGKYFTNLNAWKLEKVAVNPPPAAPVGDGGLPTEEPPFTNFSDGNDMMAGDLDDLPF
ncbi:MAG: DUF3127 domain-containing protein [Saprospiraceae bacterium]|nr:DUF3127 domain-containing protein [Saprospiraceae bacterium]